MLCCRWECSKETSIEEFSKKPNVWTFRNEVEVDGDIATVFKILEDGAQWPLWYPKMKSVNWTSPDPKKVGTTRSVLLGSLFGNVAIDEYFVVWEDNKRYAFRFERTSLPAFTAGMEDYTLLSNPDDPSKTKFIYTVYLEMKYLFRINFMKNMFDKQFKDAIASFQEYVHAKTTNVITSSSDNRI